MGFWNSLFRSSSSQFLSAVDSGDLERVKGLLNDRPRLAFYKDAEGYTPLHWAVYRGHRDVAEFLLASKADVNATSKAGETPLHRAVDGDHKQTAELLLAKGADVNAKDEAGEMPLFTAVLMARTDMAKLLLVNGADANARQANGLTMLHTAVGCPFTSFRKDLAELLLLHGADVNAQGSKFTPLSLALVGGDLEVATLLRQHGGHE